MLQMKWSGAALCRFALVSCALLLPTALPTSAVAQDAADDAQDDPLAIPKDASADELLEFSQRLMRQRPEGETEEEQTDAIRATVTTLLETSERILKIAETPRHKLNGFHLKAMSLQTLGQLGDERATRRYEKELTAAKMSADPALANVAWQMYLGEMLDRWPITAQEKAGLIKELTAAIKKHGAHPFHVNIVSQISDQLANFDPEFAKEMANAALPLFQKSKDDEVVAAAVDLEGLARRLNLPGNQIEIFGTLMDGGQVDWKTYRGKVVLVDFWATWCGPCRQEVPNILNMYDAYHEKGFEVLGISLDKSEAKAADYVEENQIPWPSLFPEDKNQRGWNHPLVSYYGIRGIPTAILVDTDGRVVSMNARGRILREQLRELLGEPAESEKNEDG